MPLPAELHDYAADLAFKKGDPHGGFTRFEQFAGDCAGMEDYIVMLQILAYAQGRTDTAAIFDFLEQCLNSEFEEVRKNASFFTVPRFLKSGKVARERLLPILKRISEDDSSEAVRKSASAGLFIVGEISEEAFKRIHEGSQQQDV